LNKTLVNVNQSVENKMKITKEKLVKLIKEELDAVANKEAPEEEVNEDVGVGTIALGTALGIVGLFGVTVGAKWLYDGGKLIWAQLQREAKSRAREIAGQIGREEQARILQELESDQELMEMFKYHQDMLQLRQQYKGVRGDWGKAVRASEDKARKAFSAALDERTMAALRSSPQLKQLIDAGGDVQQRAVTGARRDFRRGLGHQES